MRACLNFAFIVRRKAAWVYWLSLLVYPAHSGAAEAGERVLDNLLSSFALDWEEETSWEALQRKFQVNFAMSSALGRQAENLGRNTSIGSSLRGQFSFKYTDLGYWFLRADAFHYFEKDHKAPWEPDFTYAFGYDDWHPYTLGFTYDNYAANNFNPDRSVGEQFTPYSEGTYHLSWKFRIPQVLARPFLLEPESPVSCQVAYNYTPRYRDNNGIPHWGKRTFNLGCAIPVFAGISFRFNLLHYPDIRQQQPWNPDYTYEVQYNTQALGGFSIAYKNYSGNRYPWRREYANNGGLEHGSISFNWSWIWR